MIIPPLALILGAAIGLIARSRRRVIWLIALSAPVQSRRGQSFEVLFDELRKVREQRIQLLDRLSDDQLARPVPGSQRDLQWGALLGNTRHAEAHLEIVQRALSETGA